MMNINIISLVRYLFLLYYLKIISQNKIIREKMKSSHDSKLNNDKEIPERFYQPLVDTTVFDDVHIDDYSLKLLKLGLPSQRYAVVGYIDDEKHCVHLSFRPSFPAPPPNESTESREKRLHSPERKCFDPNDVVQAITHVPGSVHYDTMHLTYQYYHKITEAKPPHYLKSKHIIGLSFKKLDENILNWLNRSTKNYSTFAVNPVAECCFYFKDTQYTFDRPEYTNIVNLERSLESIAYKKIIKGTENTLLAQNDLKAIPATQVMFHQKNSDLIEEAAFNIDIQQEWDKIRKDKNKIAKYMMRTIYYASALENKETIFPQPTNAEVVEKVLKVAKEYGIELDFNFVPKEVLGCCSTTALMHAISINDKKIVNLLLDYPGAKHQLETQNFEGKTALSMALERKDYDLAIWLIFKGAKISLNLGFSILQRNDKEIDEWLAKRAHYNESDDYSKVIESCNNHLMKAYIHKNDFAAVKEILDTNKNFSLFNQYSDGSENTFVDLLTKQFTNESMTLANMKLFKNAIPDHLFKKILHTQDHFGKTILTKVFLRVETFSDQMQTMANWLISQGATLSPDEIKIIVRAENYEFIESLINSGMILDSYQMKILVTESISHIRSSKHLDDRLEYFNKVLEIENSLGRIIRSYMTRQASLLQDKSLFQLKNTNLWQLFKDELHFLQTSKLTA